MKITKINDNIFKVEIATPYDLAMTFIRPQEYYENPEWREKIFTLGQFKDWYTRKYGAFTYSSDWSGFNIPGHVLAPFYAGLFDPLTENERRFLEVFEHRTLNEIYIIGVTPNSDSLEHEICHGLFYTNQNYRLEVQDLITTNRAAFDEVFKCVSGKMYHESVWLDEVHAYSSADYEWLADEGVKLDKKYHEQLRAMRVKYGPAGTESV